MIAASRTHAARGILLMIAAVTVLSLMDTTTKYLARSYPVQEVVWARFVSQTLLMLLVLGPRTGSGLVATSRPALQVLRGIVLLSASLFFVGALSRMPIADATAIGFLAPLIITVLSVPMLGERVDAASYLAVLFGFGGVLVIMRPGAGVYSWPALLALCAAGSFALFQVLTRKIASIDRTLPTLFYQALVGATVMSCVIPFYWKVPESAAHILLFLLTGILASVGHYIMIKAYQTAPAPVIAPFVYAQLVVVIGLGYSIFGELPDHWSLLGMVIVVASGAFIFRHHRGTQRSADE